MLKKSILIDNQSSKLSKQYVEYVNISVKKIILTLFPVIIPPVNVQFHAKFTINQRDIFLSVCIRIKKLGATKSQNKKIPSGIAHLHSRNKLQYEQIII